MRWAKRHFLETCFILNIGQEMGKISETNKNNVSGGGTNSGNFTFPPLQQDRNLTLHVPDSSKHCVGGNAHVHNVHCVVLAVVGLDNHEFVIF